MKIKDMTKPELEALSFTDLTDILLKEKKKSMNTAQLFHKICELLNHSEEFYESNIGEFYTSLTTDKRFLLLESGEWDLKDRHSVKVVLEDDSDEEEMEEETQPEEETSEEEENIDATLNDDDDLTDDDDMDDLVIVDEEELDEE